MKDKSANFEMLSLEIEWEMCVFRFTLNQRCSLRPHTVWSRWRSLPVRLLQRCAHRKRVRLRTRIRSESADHPVFVMGGEKSAETEISFCIIKIQNFVNSLVSFWRPVWLGDDDRVYLLRMLEIRCGVFAAIHNKESCVCSLWHLAHLNI